MEAFIELSKTLRSVFSSMLGQGAILAPRAFAHCHVASHGTCLIFRGTFDGLFLFFLAN